jgi:hypothetical protein
VLDRAPHRSGIACAPVHSENGILPKQRREHGPAAVPAARVNSHHALDWLGLLVQRIHEAREPRGTVMGDDHRGNDVLGVRVGRRQEIRLLSGESEPSA